MSKDTLTSKKNNRKYILYISIVIFTISLTTLVYRLGVNFYERYEAVKEEINQKQKKQEISSFNNDYEFWSGSQSKSGVESIIDKAITNNSKNEEHQIEFVFDGNNYGKDIDSIKSIKESLKNFNGYNLQQYEITLSYGEDGYINKITIETVITQEQKKQEVDSFNRSYEFWSGSQIKESVESIIDKAITNNSKNEEHQIEFVFDGNNYGKDIDSIKSIKESLKDFNGYGIQKYEITFSYGEDGYINKVIIETK